ncbi:MAG: dihydrofolate reductase [Candidatus Peregrinibacteria bacterium]
MPIITLIAAIGEKFEIGEKNKLLCDLPEDMRHFWETTKGKTVVMGRKTFESIGKPLPNRKNIVITRDKNFTAEGVSIAYTPEEILENAEDLFIIGGSEIYRLFLPYATHLSLTHIHAHFHQADAFFPTVDFEEWTELSRTHFARDERHAYGFEVVEYERGKASS